MSDYFEIAYNMQLQITNDLEIQCAGIKKILRSIYNIHDESNRNSSISTRSLVHSALQYDVGTKFLKQLNESENKRHEQSKVVARLSRLCEDKDKEILELQKQLKEKDSIIYKLTSNDENDRQVRYLIERIQKLEDEINNKEH